MSIWQNFKEADHFFEKRFFAVLALIGIILFVSFQIDHLVGELMDKFPVIEKLLADNGRSFFFFAISYIAIHLVGLILYYRTLDFCEAETNSSRNALVIWAVLPVSFWTSWSIFCAILTCRTQSPGFGIKIFLLMLTVLPGLMAWFVSRRNRLNAILQNEDSNDPYTIFVQRRYYTGYYGLVCLPVYLISLLIAHLFL